MGTFGKSDRFRTTKNGTSSVMMNGRHSDDLFQTQRLHRDAASGETGEGVSWMD